MVVNENGLITEGKEKTDETLNSIETFESIGQNNLRDTVVEKDNQENISEIDTSETSIIQDASKQPNIEQKNETAETNCLALTVRKDYNLSIVKNTIITTFRFSWKIAFSTLILNILKLFL